MSEYHTRKYTASILINLTPEQKARIERRAKAHDVTVSEFVRSLI